MKSKILVFILLFVNCVFGASYGYDSVKGVNYYFGKKDLDATSETWNKISGEYERNKWVSGDWKHWAGEYFETTGAYVLKDANVTIGPTKVDKTNGGIYAAYLKNNAQSDLGIEEVEFKSLDKDQKEQTIKVNASKVRAQNNEINIEGNSQLFLLYGGYVESNSRADALNNRVNITSSYLTNKGEMYGGYVSGKGDAIANSVFIYSVGQVEEKQKTKRNGLAIAAGALTLVAGIASAVVGGAPLIGVAAGAITAGSGIVTMVDGAKETKNVVVLNKDYGKLAVGGYTSGGNAYMNNVFITSAMMGETNDMTIYGGWSEGKAGYGSGKIDGDAYANSVIATNSGKSNAHLHISGAKANDGRAYGNVVVAKGGKYGQIIGAEAKYETFGNFVHVGEIGADAYKLGGEYGDVMMIYGGNSFGNDKNAISMNNNVSISNVTTGRRNDSGGFFGGYGTYGAGENNITIFASNINKRDIYGGYGREMNATKNNVLIGDSSIDNGKIQGGASQNSEATQNLVRILNSTIKKNVNIYGGYSTKGDVKHNAVVIEPGTDKYSVINGNIYGGYSLNGAATNNAIFIDRAQVSGQVYAGYSKNPANNNSVIIKASDAGGKVSSVVHGSNNSYENTLYLHNTGNNVQEVKFDHFDKIYYVGAVSGYHWIYSKDQSPEQIKEMHSITENAIPKVDDIINRASKQMPPQDSKKTEHYDKIRVTNLLSNTLYEAYILRENAGKLEHVYQGTYARPEAKAFSEGNIASAVAIMQNNDALSDGIDSVANMSKELSTLKAGTSAVGGFGTAETGTSRYNTGSHVNTTGINISVGASYLSDFSLGRLMAGPFVEYAYSDYETHNDFGYGDHIGDGESHSYGAGAFVRFETNEFGTGHAFIEGSAKIGRSHNKYSTMIDNENVEYTSNSNYYGAHVGAGYVFSATKSSKIEVYGKYFYTRLGKDSVKVGDDYIDFAALNSHRTRFGAKYIYEHFTPNNALIAPYIGLAWDREFSGDANAKTHQRGVDAPSFKGDTGVIQAGIKGAGINGISVDFGLNGNYGKRRGVGANLAVKYEF